MRQYPRSVKLENKPETAKLVHNEQEEYEAGLKGYESHWSPEINKKRKGTDREILRAEPTVTMDEDGNAIYSIPEKKLVEKVSEKAVKMVVKDLKPADGIQPRIDALTPGQKGAITRKKNREAKLKEV